MPSHAGNPGSNPGGITKKIKGLAGVGAKPFLIPNVIPNTHFGYPK